jgi:hypothetical protein
MDGKEDRRQESVVRRQENGKGRKIGRMEGWGKQKPDT